jgi:hypothetical protein
MQRVDRRELGSVEGGGQQALSDNGSMRHGTESELALGRSLAKGYVAFNTSAHDPSRCCGGRRSLDVTSAAPGGPSRSKGHIGAELAAAVFGVAAWNEKPNGLKQGVRAGNYFGFIRGHWQVDVAKILDNSAVFADGGIEAPLERWVRGHHRYIIDEDRMDDAIRPRALSGLGQDWKEIEF